jgi:hyperosmotically inducible protein
MVLIISSSAHAADTNIKQLEDARQQSQIATSYALNPYLRANDLKVQVDGGKATLSGKVAEDVTKNLATEIARAVTGITSVDNHIVVEPTYLPHLAPVRWGDKIDDASIAAAIRAKLRWNKDIDSVNIDVSSQMGRVNLTGRADHQAAKELAGQLAANTRGVTSVKNNLVVSSAPLSKEEREQMDEHAKMHNISDSWITAKVKSSFMYSSNINSSDINVSTNNGVVTLTGNVDSGIERAFAIKMAQNIRGVKSVNSTELKF